MQRASERQAVPTPPCVDDLPPPLRAEVPRDPRPLAHLWNRLPLVASALATLLVPTFLHLVTGAPPGLTVATLVLGALATAFFGTQLAAIRRILTRGQVVPGRIEEVRAGHVPRLPSARHPEGEDLERIQVDVRVAYVDPDGAARRGAICYRTARLGEVEVSGMPVAVFCDPANGRFFATFLPRSGMVFGRAPR